VLAGTSEWRPSPPAVVAVNTGEPASEGGMPVSQTESLLLFLVVGRPLLPSVVCVTGGGPSGARQRAGRGMGHGSRCGTDGKECTKQ
jgi:hypothetical protein